jgi:hypothetical protein
VFPVVVSTSKSLLMRKLMRKSLLKRGPEKRKTAQSMAPKMLPKTKWNVHHRNSNALQKFSVWPNSPTLYCWLVSRSFRI